MEAERLTALKAYMQVEHDEDDGLIMGLYEAAVEYLAGAGVQPPSSGPTALYDLAVNGLVLGYFDEMRLTGEDSGKREEAPGLRRIINQLKASSLDAGD